MASQRRGGLQNKEVIKTVLRHIDNNPGVLNTRDLQAAFLKELTTATDIYYFARDQKKPHDERTLYRTLTSMINDHSRRHSQRSVKDLFALGSKAVDMTYLERLGYNIDDNDDHIPIEIPGTSDDGEYSQQDHQIGRSTRDYRASANEGKLQLTNQADLQRKSEVALGEKGGSTARISRHRSPLQNASSQGQAKQQTTDASISRLELSNDQKKRKSPERDPLEEDAHQKRRKVKDESIAHPGSASPKLPNDGKKRKSPTEGAHEVNESEKRPKIDVRSISPANTTTHKPVTAQGDAELTSDTLLRPQRQNSPLSSLTVTHGGQVDKSRLGSDGNSHVDRSITPPNHDGNAAQAATRKLSSEVATLKQVQKLQLKSTSAPPHQAEMQASAAPAITPIATVHASLIEEDWDEQVRRRAGEINKAIVRATGVLFDDIKEEPIASADLAPSPCSTLLELYTQVLGCEKWEAQAVHLQCRKRLPSVFFLHSLVSAFLYLHVFSESLPWDTVYDAFSCSALQSFLKPELERRNVDLVRTLHYAAKAQLTSAEFRENVIRPQGSLLANKLMAALNGHLEQLAKKEVGHVWANRLLRGFEGICTQALALQALMKFCKQKACSDTYVPQWPIKDDKFDEETMTPSEYSQGEEVAFALSMSVICHPGRKEWPNTVPVLAEVLML